MRFLKFVIVSQGCWRLEGISYSYTFIYREYFYYLFSLFSQRAASFEKLKMKFNR